jgi:FlaA1/EpsC-like NDP-sugar epimerase
MFNNKKLLVFAVDLFLIIISYVMALLLRFDFYLEFLRDQLFLDMLLIILPVKALVFFTFGVYRNLWRYASIQDLIEIFKTVSLASLLSVFALIFFHDFEYFPRSLLVIDWLLLFVFMSASRLAWRLYRDAYLLSGSSYGKRTFIAGAGEAGSLLLKEIRKQRDSIYNIVGFIDDDPEKHGMRLNGIPVLGSTDSLNELVKKHSVEKVIIALPSAAGKVIRSIVGKCENAQVRFKIIPGLGDLIKGKISVSQIKDVEIEDLLRRDPVVLDEAEISNYLAGKNVLVSGAGGSIGSEICRQVARFKPERLVLLDNAETPLFFIEKELVSSHPELRVIPVIGDVRQKDKVAMTFDLFKPDVVFHAAAYKHVPMMEYNPVESVTNNIGGAMTLADAAHRFGATDFVMISTDKAVNPTNVMGASKRVAELYVQSLAEISATRFTTVRFGNVLGSNGSVIPLFKDQIQKGGPVTVTDPEVVRYFMTIPEAAQLVLQAGCIGNGGEIFLLDMGEPVRIVELAEELIRLSGFIPHEDIEIVYSGLRPGEKLFEELLVAGEGVKPTIHEKIKVLAPVCLDRAWLSNELDYLFVAASTNGVGGILASLRRLVPEFKPAYHFNGSPPVSFRRMRPDLYPQE